MSKEAELFIWKMLRSGHSPDRLVTELEGKLAGLEQDEFSAWVTSFQTYLLNTGLHRQLIEWMIRHPEHLSWSHLGSVLNHIRPFPEEEFQHWVERAKQERRESELLRSLTRSDLSEPFAKIRKKWLRQSRKNTEGMRQELIEKLQVARLQLLKDQEKEILSELSTLFPADPEIRQLRHRAREEWAHEVLAGRRRSQAHPTSSGRRERSAEEKELLQLLRQQALQWTTEEPTLGYDLAILFVFLEDFTSAQAVAQKLPRGLARDWLIVECYRENREYIHALEFLDELEKTYAEIPDLAFSIALERSRCFWEIGQRDMAIHLLESVTRMRPDFKGAASLLHKWKEGAP